MQASFHRAEILPSHSPIFNHETPYSSNDSFRGSSEIIHIKNKKPHPFYLSGPSYNFCQSLDHLGLNSPCSQAGFLLLLYVPDLLLIAWFKSTWLLLVSEVTPGCFHAWSMMHVGEFLRKRNFRWLVALMPGKEVTAVKKACSSRMGEVKSGQRRKGLYSLEFVLNYVRAEREGKWNEGASKLWTPFGEEWEMKAKVTKEPQC